MHASFANEIIDQCQQALDLVPTKLHERSPIFLGSYDDVEEIKALYAAEEEKKWTWIAFCLSQHVGLRNGFQLGI